MNNINIDDFRMKLPFVIDILDRTQNNEMIANYYNKLLLKNIPYAARKQFTNLIDEKAIRIARCGKSMFIDEFQNQGIRDLQSISFCGNRFCQNCQKQKALTRFLKFKPILDNANEKYTLCHIALTVPNCPSEKLEGTVKTMQKSFYHLHRYFTGNIKIKNVNFLQYGYAGSVRALETTYKYKNRPKEQEYHPHFHAIMAFKKDFTLNKTIYNKYSVSNRSLEVRLFSEIEILIQKLWYLLNTPHDKRITVKDIENVPDGFSCVMDIITDDSYYEVFKYVNKVFGEDKVKMRFDQFEVLENMLRNRRTIQGYGCFYGITDIYEIDESFVECRDIIRTYLKRTELPINKGFHINEVMDDMCQDIPDYTYLNMKAIHNLDPEIINKVLAAPNDDEQLKSALNCLHIHRKAKEIDNQEIKLIYHFARMWGCIKVLNGGKEISYDWEKFRLLYEQRRKDIINGKYIKQLEMF
jgi:plasmid rolling circle replication initiator protein Rep